MRAQELSGSQEVARRLMVPTRKAAAGSADVQVENSKRTEDHVETSSLGKIISRLTKRLEAETRVREQRLSAYKSISLSDQVEIPDNAIDKILSRVVKS